MEVVGKISIEEAKRLNNRNRGNKCGCITTVYCEKCGAVHQDGICCCIALTCGFKCLECGEENVFLKFAEIKKENEPFDYSQLYCSPEAFKDIMNWGKNPDESKNEVENERNS